MLIDAARESCASEEEHEDRKARHDAAQNGTGFHATDFLQDVRGAGEGLSSMTGAPRVAANCLWTDSGSRKPRNFRRVFGTNCRLRLLAGTSSIRLGHSLIWFQLADLPLLKDARDRAGDGVPTVGFTGQLTFAAARQAVGYFAFRLFSVVPQYDSINPSNSMRCRAG